MATMAVATSARHNRDEDHARSTTPPSAAKLPPPVLGELPPTTESFRAEDSRFGGDMVGAAGARTGPFSRRGQLKSASPCTLLVGVRNVARNAATAARVRSRSLSNTERHEGLLSGFATPKIETCEVCLGRRTLASHVDVTRVPSEPSPKSSC